MNADIEAKLNRNDWAAHNLKKKAFGSIMDHVDTCIKKADTKESYDHYSRVRSQMLGKYNKYNNSDYKN